MSCIKKFYTFFDNFCFQLLQNTAVTIVCKYVFFYTRVTYKDFNFRNIQRKIFSINYVTHAQALTVSSLVLKY